MANEGMLVTAGATLVAAACFLLAAHAAHQGAPRRSQRATICAFYVLVGVFLSLSAARQVFAYAGMETADRLLFMALVVPAGFAVVPLVHVTRLVLWGDGRGKWLDGLFASVVLFGLVMFYRGGVDGPVASYWGTDWTIRSTAAQAVLGLGVVLPALVAGLTVVAVARRLHGPDRRRLRAVGWSIVVYYVVFATDAFALSGGVLLAEWLVTAAAALWAWSAYRRHGGRLEAGFAPAGTGALR